MSRREQAVNAWADYVLRFRSTPRACIGFCFPGFEDFRVDLALMRDICIELNRRAGA
jgi:hypothetical protein